MKKSCWCLGGLFCLLSDFAALAQTPKMDYASLPLTFEANTGQTNPQVKFLSRGRGYTLFLTRGEAVLFLAQSEKNSTGADSLSSYQTDKLRNMNVEVLRLKFVGVNREPRIEALDELPGKSNYFLSNDPTKWRTNVPTYARVKYHEIYPGVDLAYYGNQGQMEEDFIVSPAASVQAIRLAIAGAKKLRVDTQGNLSMLVNGGELILRKPAIYQTQNGVKRLIEGRYVLRGKREVGFKVAAYDRKLPLIIDPVLSYSTYLGGTTGSTVATGVAVDALGNAYVTGPTTSVDFPTTLGSYQSSAPLGSTSAFISKISPDGKSLIFSTYLGGSLSNQGPGGSNTGTSGISVDTAGNVYVVGSTTATDFPTVNAFQQTCNLCAATAASYDVFITKLNPTGSTVLYSSYIGGSSRDFGNAIAVDNLGGAYVTGGTVSTDFPTTQGAIQSICGTDGTCNANVNGPGEDMFVARFDTTKSGSASLVYSTYLGNSSSGLGIAFDSTGSAYVTGVTTASNFPTTAGAFQQQCGCSSSSADAFVAKINPSGSALVYSTYLGGSSTEFGYSIAVDTAGNAYITGVTSSSDFPITSGAFQTTSSGGTFAYVTKLSSTGSGLMYSTYLGAGANGFAEGDGIAVDDAGNAYVVGRTGATNFPTVNPTQPNFGGGFSDIFVSKLDPTGSQLLFSTYLGGSDNDGSIDGWFEKVGLGIAVSPIGDVYVAGTTESRDYPTTPGAFQTAPPALFNAVVTRISGLPGGSGVPLHTLTVASTNPSSGVQMTASPADNSNVNSGITPFALAYTQGTPVTVTAPVLAAGNAFSSWTGCDSPPSGPICGVTMTGDRTVTANYATPLFAPPPQPVPTSLTLSANPSSVIETVTSMSTVIASVFDQFGAAMPGVTVLFATTAGTLSSSSTQTDTNGQATVALAPTSSDAPINATVTATALSVESSVSVTFVPQASTPTNWMNSSLFNIKKLSIDLGQYWSPSVSSYNRLCEFFHNLLPVCAGAPINLSVNGPLPAASVYVVTPSSATVRTSQFAAGLTQFFSIVECVQPSQTNCIPAGYSPAAAVILQVPAVQLSNAVFKSLLQPPLSFSLGILPLLASSTITTTASGYVDLMLTISQNSTHPQLLNDLLGGIAADLAALAKGGSAAANTVTFLQSVLQVMLDTGDVTVSIVTTDLDQSGTLSSFVLLDLAQVETALSNVLQVGSLEMSLMNISQYGIETAILLVTADPGAIVTGARLIVTTFDVCVDLLPDIIPSLQNSGLFQWFRTSVDALTAIVDPPNATIVPSFSDSSGLLILGYDPGDGTVKYASPHGVLFPAGNGYLALLDERSANPTTYSATLTALGGNAPIPYSIRIRSYNRNQTEQRYSGMLLAGTSLTIPVQLDPASGALTRQPHLSPNLNAQQAGGGLTFTAKSLLDDGSQASASQAFVVLNGQQYTMVQEDSSTFTLNAPRNIPNPTVATAYVISSNVPGGFAATTLRPEIALSTNSVSFLGQPVGTASAAQSIGITNAGTAGLTISAISITGPARSDFVITNGTTCTVSVDAVPIAISCTINVIFSPTAIGSRSAILSVTDNAPGSPHKISLSGTGLDSPPFANAGADHTVECKGPNGTPVTLDGSASGDLDGDALTYKWTDPLGNVVGNSAIVTTAASMGTQTYTLTVTDPSGFSATAQTHVTVRDTTPPVLTLTKSTVTVVVPTAPATGAIVNLSGIASATDICDANPTITNDAPANSFFAIGATTVTVTATDHSGNFSQKKLTVQVVYAFSGYLVPVLNNGSAIFNSGRTIPVKSQLTAADGTFVTNAIANLQVFQVLNTPTGTVDMTVNTVASGSSNTGTRFRYDPTSNQYIYNLSTQGFVSGTYLLRTTLNDGTTHDVQISIK
jgi:hypothetical protein